MSSLFSALLGLSFFFFLVSLSQLADSPPSPHLLIPRTLFMRRRAPKVLHGPGSFQTPPSGLAHPGVCPRFLWLAYPVPSPGSTVFSSPFARGLSVLPEDK